jgi:hypothetical protein
MRRWPRLRGTRRALSDFVVRRLWQSLVDFGAAHDPHAARYADDEPPRQCPGGPPPGHPERVREDVPLSAVELRIARELRPTRSERHSGRRAPDAT